MTSFFLTHRLKRCCITFLSLGLLMVAQVGQAQYKIVYDSETQKAHDQEYKALAHHEESHDLWQALRQSFTLPHETYRPEVQSQIAWFVKHKKIIYDMAVNSKPYLYYIKEQVKKRNLPIELVLLPMIESGYDPFAYSPAGAAGLWQMMPGTASGFGLKQNWWYDGRRDVVASTNAALNYLVYLQNFFNGSWILALAAYDTGEGSVLSAIKKNIAHGKGTDFWSLPLSRETQAYIPKLLALAEIISHPEKYPVELPEVINKPYLSQVDIGSQIDLKTAAELSGLTLKELLKLNPGYNRWATSPEGPNRLILPIDHVATFKDNLSKLPEDQRVTWQRYTVQRGDSLSSVSANYHTSVSLLKKVNKLQGDFIKEGQTLFIPLSTNRLPSEVISSAQKYVDVEQKELPGPKQVLYVVQNGDTLWTVSKKYHTKVNAIRFWNNLKPNAVLQPGQELVMWFNKRHSSSSKITTMTYTVKHGDSLGVIARRYNTTVDTIERENDLDNSVIQPGQHLLIHKNLKIHTFPDTKMLIYYVRAGDSLTKLAYKFNTNVNTLKSLNGLHSTMLSIGQKLIIVPNALPSVKKLAGDGTDDMVYIVQPNDNLTDIARKYNVTVEQLLQWNPSVPESKIVNPDDLLTIYQ